jgi:hypothetical protein
MRWLMAGTICLTLFLAGCGVHTGTNLVPPLPVGAPAGLQAITPQQFAQFQPVVNRYFYYRKQAVIAQDVAILHWEYPDLKQRTDVRAGINAESDTIARYKGLAVIDGNVEPEHYARFLVREDGNSAVLLVNGSEMYLRNEFGDSGGQLQLLLFLERRSGVWTIVKTDETTLAEYHQALH